MTQVIVLAALGLVGLIAWYTLRPRAGVKAVESKTPDGALPLAETPKPPPPTLHIDVYIDGALADSPSVTREIVKIGSDVRSHVRLLAPQVSRMHAVIEAVSADEITLVDLGSREGTMLNGQTVHKAPLRHGDVIVVGTARLIVGVGKAPPRETPAATDSTASGA